MVLDPKLEDVKDLEATGRRNYTQEMPPSLLQISTTALRLVIIVMVNLLTQESENMDV